MEKFLLQKGNFRNPKYPYQTINLVCNCIIKGLTISNPR